MNHLRDAPDRASTPPPLRRITLCPVSVRTVALRPTWLRATALRMAACFALLPLAAVAQPAVSHSITRATGPIEIDGDIQDPAWANALRVDTWYETSPRNNVPPDAPNVAWLTYDDKYFYVAFDFSDPRPRDIRAPFGDHDGLTSSHDYGGIFIDASNDGKTALLFLSTARGVQYDAISSDVTGDEDSTPDFYWDSSARITDTGWTLEMRIPFSSLRYPNTDPQTWGILLYRNWPRVNRTQVFSTPLARGVQCLVCQSTKLEGLSGLKHGGHWTIAPYATARQVARPEAGPGSRLDNGSVQADAGVDAKWIPNADTAVDLTINPDFSQVEADESQISTNERFALFVDEKRPFFLEGKDLFSTPIQAVYTRTVTDPNWGLRATGRLGTTSYTVLTTNDEGGGLVVVPGATGSELVEQDFKSVVGITRLRYDVGQSFISFLATAREIHGDAYNRVYGPDFGWKPSNIDRVNGQLLFSQTRTPNRTDLHEQWDGRKLGSHAGTFEWIHSTTNYDWFAEYHDVGEHFRADNGFVPQVGYRAAIAEAGYTFRPTGFLTRIRPFLEAERYEDRDRELLSDYVGPAVNMDGGFHSMMRYQYRMEHVRAGEQILPFNRLTAIVELRPSLLFSEIELEASAGQAVDFANSRRGHGGDVDLFASIRPTDHLAFGVSVGWRWLDVDATGQRQRLFTAKALQLRTTYTFTSRTYLRLIGQYVTTARNRELYIDPVPAREESFNATALFTYKLNWQSVLYAGYGDERALDDTQPDRQGLDRVSRQWFLKVSYAFQGN